MSSFNEFCTDAKRLATKAAKKTGELAHHAALLLKLEGVKNCISANFEKLGRLTYKQLKVGESQAEKIAAVMSTIDALRIEETKLKKQIDDLKKAKNQE